MTAATGGELSALHEFVTTTLPDRRDALNTWVTDLATTLNTQHAAGFTALGAAGTDLLAVGADAAGTVGVAITDVADLAVGTVLGAGGLPGPLDGTNAQALADLRSAGTLGTDLHAMVVDLGAAVAGARRAADAAGDVAVGAEVARQSQHGVSLDEEMVDIVRFQRQLEAASRVMTAVDQALDTLVNRVGIVGR